jgi:putative ABC transport system ATP-binding protein
MSVLFVEHLVKSYASPEGGRPTVVDVPRFAMEPGELVALRGESGSGKTTFLNLVAGILEADSGRIVIDDVDMESLDEAHRDRLRAETIGYVFQTFNLLQGYTALENVELGMAFGRGIDAAHARLLLERVGLEGRMHYRPRQLSVGQQQRVAIARALANRPRLVLADEPTGNLDPVRAQEAIDLLLECCRETGAALLLVSHDTNVLSRFGDVRQLADINRARPLAAQTGA